MESPRRQDTRVLRLEELLVQVDYLSLHVPYMPQTHHMLNKEALQLLARLQHHRADRHGYAGLTVR